MKRRSKMYLFLFLLLAIAVIVPVVFCQPCFGRNPKGQRLERVKQSPFYKDGEFQNEEPTVLMTGKHSYLTSMWDMLTGRKKSKHLIPKEGEVPVVKNDLKHLPKDKDLYVWFGHSSFLLQLSGKALLIDPVFISFSPVSSIMGKVFPGTDIYKPEDMPDTIDYLVISHDHYDHLDHKTVVALKDRVGKVVCPLGVGENFEHWGYAKEQIIELDCNENYAEDFVFRCLPTRHFSGRSLKRNTTQRAAWLIETPKRKIFYSGDGGYGVRYRRFGEQFPDIDLAIMENGQYDVNWSNIHTMPEELGREVSELNPNRFVTVHHSKVALANHAWDEPRENERKAAEESGIPLIVCSIGEIVELD